MENEPKVYPVPQMTGPGDQAKKQDYQKKETDPGNPTMHQEKGLSASEKQDLESDGAPESEIGEQMTTPAQPVTVAKGSGEKPGAEIADPSYPIPSGI